MDLTVCEAVWAAARDVDVPDGWPVEPVAAAVERLLDVRPRPAPDRGFAVGGHATFVVCGDVHLAEYTAYPDSARDGPFGVPELAGLCGVRRWSSNRYCPETAWRVGVTFSFGESRVEPTAFEVWVGAARGPIYHTIVDAFRAAFRGRRRHTGIVPPPRLVFPFQAPAVDAGPPQT